MTEEANQTPSDFKRNLTWLGVGVALGIVGQGMFFRNTLGPIAFDIGVLGYIGLWISHSPLSESDRVRGCWLLFAGIATYSLPFMAVRAHAIVEVDQQILAFIGVLTAAVTLPPVFLASKKKDTTRKRIPFNGTHAVFTAAISIACIAGFQVSQRILRSQGVPNEDRSAFLFDIELHHINWGIILVVLLSVTPIPKQAWKFFLRLTALAVAHCLIWDEAFYYARSVVNDDTYFETSTWLTAGLLSIAVPAYWCRRSMQYQADSEGLASSGGAESEGGESDGLS